MDSEARTFGAGTALTVVGLAVMLYGVSLNDGTAFNAPMLAGGVVVGAAIGLVLLGVNRLEAAH